MTDINTLFPRRQPATDPQEPALLNWAQNAMLANKNAVIHIENEQQLQQVIAAAAGKVRIMGSRMSSGRMLKLRQPGDTLIDISALRGVLAVEEDSVTFAAGTQLHEVFETLTAMNRMLHASPGVIDSQTLAGAISTGTHGQGLQQSSLADEALRIRLVDAAGTIHEVSCQQPEFAAAQLALGTLGAITAVTLRTRPTTLYTCFKSASSADNLETDLLDWNQRWALSKAWWFPQENKVHTWNARESTPDERERWRNNHGNLVELEETDEQMNAAVDKTLQQMRDDTHIVDENGKPFRTVTRFKDFSDVIGDVYQVFCRGIATPQINIEIGIPLARAPAVIARMKAWYQQSHPHMHYPIILRCTGPSQAWLNPAWQQATCFFGFVVYYAEDGSLSADGLAFLRDAEQLLAQEGGKPHWGKYFDATLYDWPTLYPQWSAFQQVRQRFDPQGKFLNAFMTELLS
ncbi:D-arabinono-1,4-lactone oxidase [Enterobacter sp. Bisph1]|uniref:D-arabinono-1,4-lactone oxidase n=1 Tax=Enterobacter sp. Bisph1 TaxID=1274399 RepID=UPI00057C1040|nr:D-arabinono-1,4-lactone oxidase [Enterobacter sp. Bisph1]